jgi:hypothetical protein
MPRTIFFLSFFLSFSCFWGNIAKELEKIFLFSLADVRLFFTRDGQSGPGTGTKIFFWLGPESKYFLNRNGTVTKIFWLGPAPKFVSERDRDRDLKLFLAGTGNKVFSSSGPKMTGPAHIYSLLYYWGVMKEDFLKFVFVCCYCFSR